MIGLITLDDVLVRMRTTYIYGPPSDLIWSLIEPSLRYHDYYWLINNAIKSPAWSEANKIITKRKIKLQFSHWTIYTWCWGFSLLFSSSNWRKIVLSNQRPSDRCPLPVVNNVGVSSIPLLYPAIDVSFLCRSQVHDTVFSLKKYCQPKIINFLHVSG